MRFLADQDVYRQTVVWLRAQGHDVATVSELGLARATDRQLLAAARKLDRRLLTRDKDFGALAYFHREASAGVILLRGSPGQLGKVHSHFRRLLEERGEEELRRSFCVVEPNCYRVRCLTRF